MNRYTWARVLLGSIPAYFLVRFYGPGAALFGGAWAILYGVTTFMEKTA